MRPAGLVNATERLYRSLFTAAAGFAVGAAIWGMAIAPLNGFNDHIGVSLALGALLVALTLPVLAHRETVFNQLRRRPAWLLLAVVVPVAVIWLDGGWRSSYYLASYAAIALAAVAGGLRWALGCAALLAIGYLGGLAVNGYSWEELEALNDADSVVANTGGYLIAAYFFAAPVRWLGGYVARINQVVDDGARAAGSETSVMVDSRARGATDSLSVREVEVVQLLAGGATNEEIAARLVLSPRTIQSHVKAAMDKTETRNRTELAVLAVRAGLVPGEESGRGAAAEPVSVDAGGC